RAQGEPVILVRVVCVARREVTDGGFGLDLDVVLVAIDLEHRLRRVADAPHHDGGDLDRVAVVVVHLELRALEVPDTLRDLVAWEREGVGPPEPWLVDRANVVAEELEYLRLVRAHDEEPAEADADGDHCEDVDD